MKPQNVPFIAPNLNYRILPAVGAPPVLFFVGSRPFYRLTPRVWHHFARLIHKTWYDASNDHQRQRMWDAASVLFSFVPWMDAHYSADEQAAGRAESQSLPVDPDYRAVEAPRHETES